MKKIALVSLFATAFLNVAFADIYEETINTCNAGAMRAALDKATVENRAVITIVKCEKPVAKPIKTVKTLCD